VVKSAGFWTSIHNCSNRPVWTSVSIENVAHQVKEALVLADALGKETANRTLVDGDNMALEKKNGKVNGVAIRPLTLSDTQDLQRYCFPEESPESVADYVERALCFVKRGQAAHLVAEAGGHAVANAQLVCWRKRAEIGSLVVAEPLRGNGIGTALIEALSDAAAELGAEQIEIGAEKWNLRVLDLYRRLGFAPHKEVLVPGDGIEKEHIVFLVKPVPPRS
jgi:ribosomal protein S18 acetylase RimI-like enzyme